MQLTELELKLLGAWARERTFCAEVQRWQDATWTFAVIDAWKAEGNDPRQLSGVMASLVKKGLIFCVDNSKERYPEDRNDQTGFTDLGATVMEELHPRFTKGKDE